MNEQTIAAAAMSLQWRFMRPCIPVEGQMYSKLALKSEKPSEK